MKNIVEYTQALKDTFVPKSDPAVPGGGTKGQVLAKTSATDGDVEWKDELYHFSTVEEMQNAIASGLVPADGANIVVDEEVPEGNTGDTALSTTSKNWVQNKVVTDAVNLKFNTSDLSSVNVDNSSKVPTSSLLYAVLNNIQSTFNIIVKRTECYSGLRFQNLGSSFTSAQQTALANGDFSDTWNGDYWVINDITWRIADNTGIMRRKGDTNFDRPSLVIFPDTNLIGAVAYLIDDSNNETHGYANCKYRTTYRSQCRTTIANAFGDSHIASHRELMSSARNNGAWGTGGATSWAWTDADVELPSEVNIYGHIAFGESAIGGSGYNIGTQWGQFRLFQLAPYMAINRSQNYWLRDISSTGRFSLVRDSGFATCDPPSTTGLGLRPFFILV